MRSLKAIPVTAAVVAFALAGCSGGGGTDDAASGGSDDVVVETAESGESGDSETVTLVVGASPSPHAQILTYIAENLAEEQGLKLEVREFNDYITPNTALDAGEIDANYFQTVPYLEEQVSEGGYDFVSGEGIHLEPLGIYSEKYTTIADVPEGATVGVIQDPTNQGRALELLAAEGLVELPAEGDANVATVTPLKGIKLIEVEGPALVRNLKDVDIAVINGNYALAGGLSPSEDALVLEDPEGNPSVNVLVWGNGSDKQAAIEKLEKILHSDDVRAYIEENWQDGSVIPAF